MSSGKIQDKTSSGKKDPPKEPDPVNQASGRLEAAFSPDGTTMILVRSDPGALQADLYQST